MTASPLVTTKKPKTGTRRTGSTVYPQATNRIDLAGANSNRLTTKRLAALILDALVDGGVLRDGDFKKAMAIACEEIDARKSVGDY